MTARLIIRASAYRGEPGFSINGRDHLGRRLKVFTETRSSAERIKGKLAKGEDIGPEDFKL